MKARCRRCWHLNYDYIFKKYRWDDPYFCGHHGCARVDPDGEQPNLDRRGGCAFTPKNEPTQIKINRDFNVADYDSRLFDDLRKAMEE